MMDAECLRFGWIWRRLLMTALWLAVAGACCSLGAAQFRASVVKIDITPDQPQWLLGYGPRQSTGVHDHIYHRIVAMDDGETQFFLVSTDICLFSPSVYDEVMSTLQAETGIKPVQVWWTVTHTHSAPEVGPPGLGAAFMGERYKHDHNTEYTARVKKSLLDGIKEARTKLEPARLGVGWGMSMANINRRGRDLQGPTYLGLNPDGPSDRQIGLIRLERADGRLLALIANYAMHGTALGPHNDLITGDAPGIVASYVEEKLGAPMLYINGAAGNLAPIYTVCPDFESAHLGQFRAMLGDKIIAANNRIGPTTSTVRLAAGEQIVETPRKANLGWAPDIEKYLRQTDAGETVIRLPIRFLRVNDDVAVWAAPVELFCEIALRVRSLSPYPYTFYFGYSNGWLGYMPSAAEFPYGGYEPATSPYTPKAEDDVVRTVVGYLQGSTR
ncbi:MAG: neutral/alkaline non-lysosomal ceramidase N-terminal domain-containing protein [Terriglobia bacterium]|jgi:hypothetical protein